jgi:hypothetical protein
MGFLRNIKESIDDTSTISVSGITLLISSFIGFLLGLVMCFVLVYDVVTNGYLKTDLTDAGIFLLCSGGYIAGSGIPRSIVDSRLKAKTNIANERLEAEFENKYNRSTKKRRKRDEENDDDESYEKDTDNEK